MKPMTLAWIVQKAPSIYARDKVLLRCDDTWTTHDSLTINNVGELFLFKHDWVKNLVRSKDRGIAFGANREQNHGVSHDNAKGTKNRQKT